MNTDVTGNSLASLLVGIAGPAPALQVKALQLDSRAVAPGDLFIALRGRDHDGRAYLAQAAAAGAVAALVEDALIDAAAPLPVIVVPGLRQQLGEIASRFYQRPSQSMHVTAVTGTNGKTTVSHLLAQLIRAAGYDCGVIGTLGASLDSQAHAVLNTTPDPVELQRTLADWAGQAVPFVSMEASSHALDQGRVNGLDLDTAIFTNLTRDHLDYHADMQAYGEAKARLFDFASLRAAVLNADDPFAAVLAARLHSGVRVLRYGRDATGLDVRFSALEQTSDGLRMRIQTPWGAASLRSPLLGAFNAYNLAASLSAGLEAGLPFDALIGAAQNLQPVPGRMEALRVLGAPLVVIDYAHTPDALQQVMSALRAQCGGKLIVMFGCGGDRDPGKRVLMAEAVSAGADVAVITSDNPRSEDPLRIAAAIEAGMQGDYRVCVDRADAIALAISLAGKDDCVLLAGKGHEDYQIIGAERRPFSDSAVAQEILRGHAA